MAAWGSFLLLLGIFLFGHPGRIDIIDGQFRFDVSKNILGGIGPRVSDPELLKGPLPKNLETRVPYSYYSAPPSLLPIPLMAASRALVGSKPATDRFSWSLASAFAGACIGPLLIAFFRRIGIALKSAIGWTLVFALTTLWWPSAETVFDQCQHGVVLLAMTLAAYDVARGGRTWLAFLTGILGGLLVSYRIPFFVLLVVFPRYWAYEARKVDGDPKDAKRTFILQNLLYSAGIGVAWVGYLAYNWIRFGQLDMPAYDVSGGLFGNPIAGFLTLTISPGKGLLWFSPTLLFAFFGMKPFFKADRGLAGLVLALSCLHLAEMSCLWFVGGDYCWGPRYLLPIMPLWALALPFVSAYALRPSFARSLIGAGLAVQLMGISIDFDRFFFDHRLTLPPYFNVNPWGYFHFSQWISRPGEILESIRQRNQTRPKINSNPHDDATYAPFIPQYLVDKEGYPMYPSTAGMPKPPFQTIAGTQQKSTKVRDAWFPLGPLPAPIRTNLWEQKFQIFYLPRPWWGWFNQVPSEQRPMGTRSFFIVCCLTTLLGAGTILRSVRAEKSGELEVNLQEIGT